MFIVCVIAAWGGAARAAGPVVNVYNWADYIGPDTIADFEAETGIRVNYDTYDASELVDAKLFAGNTGYDVIVHSGFFTARLLPIGLFAELDKKRLPNWRHLDRGLLEQFSGYDPDNRFIAPYMWGTVGFTYNVDMIRARMPDAPVHSAAMVFDPVIVAQFADCGVSFLDSPTDIIPMALSYLGRDPNTEDPEVLGEAEALLKSVRPFVRYFSSTKLLIDLPNREVCIGISWSGDYATALYRAEEAGVEIDLAYSVPVEGSPLWFDGSLIPLDAPNPDNAYRFIDFLLRPEVIAPISEFTHYANANHAATRLIAEEVVNDPAIYPGADVLSRTYVRAVMPPKIERIRTRLWQRVKTGL